MSTKESTTTMNLDELIAMEGLDGHPIATIADATDAGFARTLGRMIWTGVGRVAPVQPRTCGLDELVDAQIVFELDAILDAGAGWVVA